MEGGATARTPRVPGPPTRARVRKIARRLRLASFNIQAGATVRNFREYVTRGWQHVLPHHTKRTNLKLIADALVPFDIVGLQEADGGSLRSSFDNQTETLAEAAEFPFWTHQSNRRMVGVAESSNGVLSRLEPSAVYDHKLPGRIGGRGVLEVRYGNVAHGLHVFVAHLSLTPAARRIQLAFIAELLESAPNAVLMGDLNCTADSPEMCWLLDHTTLTFPGGVAPLTFPSWQPQRAIDHILVSPNLRPRKLRALPIDVSDHLPLAVDILLPARCSIDAMALPA